MNGRKWGAGPPSTIDLRLSVLILVFNDEVHAQVLTLAQVCSVSAHACSALAMDPHAKKAMGPPLHGLMVVVL